MKLIQSRDNPFYKELVKLSGSARQRNKSGQTLLDGAHLLTAYLDSGNQPRHILLNAAALNDDEIAGLLQRISEKPLMEPLAIRLGEQTTLAKSLVMAGHPKDVPVTQLDDKLFA